MLGCSIVSVSVVPQEFTRLPGSRQYAYSLTMFTARSTRQAPKSGRQSNQAHKCACYMGACKGVAASSAKSPSRSVSIGKEMQVLLCVGPVGVMPRISQCSDSVVRPRCIVVGLECLASGLCRHCVGPSVLLRPTSAALRRIKSALVLGCTGVRGWLGQAGTPSLSPTEHARVRVGAACCWVLVHRFRLHRRDRQIQPRVLPFPPTHPELRSSLGRGRGEKGSLLEEIC